MGPHVLQWGNATGEQQVTCLHQGTLTGRLLMTQLHEMFQNT